MPKPREATVAVSESAAMDTGFEARIRRGPQEIRAALEASPLVVRALDERHLRLRVRRRGGAELALELEGTGDPEVLKVRGRVVLALPTRAWALVNVGISTVILLGIPALLGLLAYLLVRGVLAETVATVVAWALCLGAVVPLARIVRREIDASARHQFERDLQRLMAVVGPQVTPYALSLEDHSAAPFRLPGGQDRRRSTDGTDRSGRRR